MLLKAWKELQMQQRRQIRPVMQLVLLAKQKHIKHTLKQIKKQDKYMLEGLADMVPQSKMLKEGIRTII